MLKDSQLFADSARDLRMRMPVQIHPPGADSIEKCFACFCEKSATLGSDNHLRRIGGLHLRIGVPENRLISLRPAHVSLEWYGAAWHISALFQSPTATRAQLSGAMATRCGAKSRPPFLDFGSH